VVTPAPAANGPVLEIAHPILIESCACAGVPATHNITAATTNVPIAANLFLRITVALLL
jgi:hypothetical protein